VFKITGGNDKQGFCMVQVCAHCLRFRACYDCCVLL
jgi:ribosomal protein S6E (S10)